MVQPQAIFHQFYDMSNQQQSSLPRVSRIRSLLYSRQLQQNPIEIFMKHTARLGNSFVFYFGGIKEVIVTSNPTFLQHILQTKDENYHKSEIETRRMLRFLGQGLLTSSGELRRMRRKLMQRAFRTNTLAAMAATMHIAVNGSLERFDRQLLEGPVDIYPVLTDLTLATVARSLFSVNLTDHERRLVGRAIIEIQEFIVRQIVHPYLTPWFFLSGQCRRYARMRTEADKALLNHIRNRRRERTDCSDLL
jgi:cytochrome P450